MPIMWFVINRDTSPFTPSVPPMPSGREQFNVIHIGKTTGVIAKAMKYPNLHT